MLEEDGLARNQIDRLHLVFSFEFANRAHHSRARRVPEVVHQDDAANREQWIEEVQRVEGRLIKISIDVHQRPRITQRIQRNLLGKETSMDDIWGVKQIGFQESLDLGEVC